MNRDKNLKDKTNSYTILHSDPDSITEMSDKITSWLPVFPREYIIVAIGTDRSTGDALGPLTGTYLEQMDLKHMQIYGTLHKPVHAQNLSDYIKKIKAKYRRPYVIAIDACLGRSSSIGKITLGTGPLFPGAALNKNLPVIGDLHITAVVNVSGFMEYAVLQNTRLSIVADMATTIASILKRVDNQLMYTHHVSATVLPEFKKNNPIEYDHNRNHFYS